MRKSSRARAKALHAGAQAFVDLVKGLETRSTADYKDFVEASGDESLGTDPVDYRVLSEVVAESIRLHLDNAPSPDHREGFLRALTESLFGHAHGSNSPLEVAPLLRVSEAAFTLPKLAQAAIAKAAA